MGSVRVLSLARMIILGHAEEAAAAKKIAFTQARAIVHDSFDDIGMKIKAEFHKLIIGQKGVKVRDMINRYDLNISEQGRKNSYSEKEKRFSVRLM